MGHVLNLEIEIDESCVSGVDWDHILRKTNENLTLNSEF